MAQLLDYHRREARPAWWAYFRRFEMDDEELLEDSDAISGLECDGAEPVPVGQSLEYTFRFPRSPSHWMAPISSSRVPLGRGRPTGERR
jgi:uncharacterized protein